MKSNEPRAENIRRLRERYRAADKRTKGSILNEFCLTWGISRKRAIALLRGQGLSLVARSGRKAVYDDRLVHHVVKLWDSMERICAKRMKAAIPVWLEFYHPEDLGPHLRAQLLKMSASTIERFLVRGRKRIKGMSLTQRDRFFRYKIPLTNSSDKIVNVGHVAADTVAHCGDNMSGSFAWSLTVTERISGWTENRAMREKTGNAVKSSISNLEQTLPFDLASIQTDCGSEFLNYTMMCYFQHRTVPVLMSRSRPYQKNDNAHVEQKNFTHVRECFGYERISDLDLVPLMNEIYREYWNPLHNFFLPQMQLLEKERVGSRIKKKHDFPKTPYERLKLGRNVTEEQKEILDRRMKSLNPFTLKRGLEQKLDLFFKLLKQGKSGRKAA